MGTAVCQDGETFCRNREWPETIPVSSEQKADNILGYTLHRNKDGMLYVRDPEYLLQDSAVGKGIFVSRYMAETEAHLGQILIRLLYEFTYTVYGLENSGPRKDAGGTGAAYDRLQWHGMRRRCGNFSGRGKVCHDRYGQ